MLADADIERIVREVIRRLREHQEKTKASPNGKTEGGAQHVAHSLEMNEHVITLASLENRLSGISRVAVGHRAVVTPAVVDELRERKVELVRCERFSP